MNAVNLGYQEGYVAYQFKDGHIEGYRSTGTIKLSNNLKIPKNCARVVTTATTIKEFIKQVRRNRKKPNNNCNSYRDKNQLSLKI